MKNMNELERLGITPSERKKIEAMGIKRLEQIALLSYDDLAMSPSKARSIIKRARKIVANDSILSIDVYEDEIKIRLRKKNMAVIKSVLDVIGVYQYPASVSMEERDDTIILRRMNRNFEKVAEGARIEKEIVEAIERGEEEIYDEDVKEFAVTHGFDGFWRNLFKFIRGNEIMKKAIATSLFSTFEEPVHTLIIGEPGSSKTLAKEIILENFSDVTSIGANTTRAGLVINLATGELGALAYSDGRVVVVDEMDKIPQQDVEYCYELLSNGKGSVHSAKIHEDIESHFIMIAFANPKGEIFKGDAISQIPLPPLLISRFALIVKTSNISREDRIELFKEKFFGIDEKKPGRIYDAWVKMARKFNPKIEVEEEAIEKYIKSIDAIIEENYKTNLRRDLRMGDYMRRIPMAIARAGFENITEEILQKSEEIIYDSIESWKR